MGHDLLFFGWVMINCYYYLIIDLVELMECYFMVVLRSNL